MSVLLTMARGLGVLTAVCIMVAVLVGLVALTVEVPWTRWVLIPSAVAGLSYLIGRDEESR